MSSDTDRKNNPDITAGGRMTLKNSTSECSGLLSERKMFATLNKTFGHDEQTINEPVAIAMISQRENPLRREW